MPDQSFLFLHLLPFFISLFFMKSYANNTTSVSEYCSTSKCGDIEVKYPFWLHSNTTSIQYCGYQSFGLNCFPSSIPGNQNLFLHLRNDDFYVKNISYNNHTVTLVDIDVTTNLTCPRARQNLSLEDIPLHYSTQDSNLTFYYNCTDPLPPLASAYALDCLRSGENKSYVSIGTNINFEWYEVCEQKIVATVIEREIKRTNAIWASMFGSAMNDGFVLDWQSGIDCAKCELSHGQCGYNNSSGKFLCFCKDNTIKHDKCKGTLYFFKSNKYTMTCGLYHGLKSFEVVTKIQQ